MKKYYVGIGSTGLRDVFKSEETPTETSHGRNYAIVIGPFRTRRGAWYMAMEGANNPHCLSVGDAERLAKEASKDHGKDKFNGIKRMFKF